MRARRTLPLLLLLMIGATTVAAAPPAGGALRAAAHPNVILILTDDQTFDALDPGSPNVMPHLESELADPASGWIDFRNFFFNNPLCCPSRATILTGRYSHHTGVEDNSGGVIGTIGGLLDLAWVGQRRLAAPNADIAAAD